MNPVQVAIQNFDNAAKRVSYIRLNLSCGIPWYCSLQVLPLLSHSKEDISNEALSLLKTLLFSGNEAVQMGLEFVKHTREEQLFGFLKHKLRHSAIQYREM